MAAYLGGSRHEACHVQKLHGDEAHAVRTPTVTGLAILPLIIGSAGTWNPVVGHASIRLSYNGEDDNRGEVILIFVQAIETTRRPGQIYLNGSEREISCSIKYSVKKEKSGMNRSSCHGQMLGRNHRHTCLGASPTDGIKKCTLPDTGFTYATNYHFHEVYGRFHPLLTL